jgi:peroxiredoxin
VTIASEITWTLEFDRDAERAGYVDCSYTRAYSGEQYLDQDYLCPECDVQTRGIAEMIIGAGCYEQISSSIGTRLEEWGFSYDSEEVYRSVISQYPMSQLSDVTVADEYLESPVSWQADYDVGDGELSLTASGVWSYWTNESRKMDNPWAPIEASSCGWGNTGHVVIPDSYDVAIGKPFPNLRLNDQCDDPVDLHSFAGSWIILDATQPDCGPCQNMAAATEDFLQSLRREGVSVNMISLMGKGLDEPWASPSRGIVDDWAEYFDLKEPVLIDRGAGIALLPDFYEDEYETSFGYPAWIILDPDMNVVRGFMGFSDFDVAREVILSGQ